jgi:NADH-quinone oxidoreductase subunit H
MVTCLKYCTPIAAAMFLGAALWQYALPQRNFFGLMRAPAAMYAVNEGWPMTPAAVKPRPETVQVDAPNRQVAAIHNGKGG